jgi:putative N6-adenine-specific DNA methylase
VFASDRLAAAVAKTRRNAALAQVEGFLAVGEADALARAAPAPSGTLVTNPPYGIRLEDKARVALMYPKLGDALKARYAGWTACLFSGDPELPKKFGLKADRRIPLWNGAIECRLYCYRIVSGKLDG